MNNLFSNTHNKGTRRRRACYARAFAGNTTLKGLLIAAAVLVLLFSGCAKEEAEEDKSFDVAVFVPGVVAGSPTYEMLVAGAERAAAEREHITVHVVEGGFNQGEWLEGVTSLAAAGSFEVILTSNPAMPEIAAAVSLQYPDQKFILLDGYLEGNNSIYSLRYNQMEQAFLNGHLAGLITASSMNGANGALKTGMVVGQEYPDMNQAIRPGFELGVTTASPEALVDFRVVGNWYDAAKAGELATSMYASGVDVILSIAGGANQGVLSAAENHGAYVLWYDSNGYSQRPGIVAGSTALEQDRAAYERVLSAADGDLPWGTAEVVGVQEGYVRFIEDDPLYIETVSEEVRERQHAMYEKMKAGEFILHMPVIN